MQRPKNEKLTQAMEGMGFSVEQVKNMVKVTGNLQATRKFIEASMGAGLGSAQESPRIADHMTGSPDAEFYGGDYSHLTNVLAGKLDMSPLLKKQEDFRRSGISQKLQTVIAQVKPKRSRVMSEYDGDWNYDRRWDLEAFESTTKRLGGARTIDILCHFAVNCTVTADQLRQYGAMAWAISDLIEKAGITTRITLKYRVDGINAYSYDGKSEPTDCDIQIEVKRPGEYIAAPSLAATMQTIFFRRPIFGMIVACANLTKQNACYGLGHARQESMRIRFKDGLLELSPETVHADPQEVEKCVLEAIRASIPGVSR